MTNRVAIFPGSFDPITLGHEDIVQRSNDLFDEIIVAVGNNTDKKYMFSTPERLAFIEATFKNYPKVKVMSFEGLTIDFAKKINAGYILRGLRNPADFEFEKAIAQTNRKLSGIETVFLLTASGKSYISSSIVRDVYRHGGDISALIPESVVKMIVK
jgi:pantetheine-phosphate adenylyltransferase